MGPGHAENRRLSCSVHERLHFRQGGRDPTADQQSVQRACPSKRLVPLRTPHWCQQPDTLFIPPM